MTERLGQIRQTTTAEVRLGEGKTAGSGSARPNGPLFWLLPGRLENLVAAEPPEMEDHVQPNGNPENVSDDPPK
jgi:hypothetical protein